MMKSSAKNIKLTSVDDIFSTKEERQYEHEERVVRLPLSEMHAFKGYPALKSKVPFCGQPYRVRDDDPKMLETLESVRQRGVRTPGLVRPDPEGGYEIISGHRRHRASELAGLPDMPVIIREMTDDEAVIELVDNNIQREDVLPSEKAWAYRMKLEALKRQGKRDDLTCGQVDHKLTGQKSRDILAEQVGESAKQISRYIRLTELIPNLLKMVDGKKISFNAAVEVSYLAQEEQAVLIDFIEQESAPSLSQAKRLKEFSQDGKLNRESMEAIMTEGRTEPQRVTLPGQKLKKYFPPDVTPSQMEETIIRLLEEWKNKGCSTVEQ